MKAKITFIGGAVAEVEGTPEEVAHILRAVPAASCTCSLSMPCPLHVVNVWWTGKLAWKPSPYANACAGAAAPAWYAFET